jgi:hypothetical protein
VTLPRVQILMDDYDTNTWLIHRLSEGVSDEESLLQLPFEANCLNWILGHIVQRRDSSLAALGWPPLWDEGISTRYRTGSDPIKTQASARLFRDLLADLDESQQLLTAALEAATDVTLDRIVENDRGVKRAIEHLRGFHWHETYHIGQLEILRSYILSRRSAKVR